MRSVRCGCCGRESFRSLTCTGTPCIYACDRCDYVQHWPTYRPEPFDWSRVEQQPSRWERIRRRFRRR